MTVIYRADKNVSFRGSAPAKSFRLGVREAVSEEWWAANFRHGDDYLRALAVRDRLQRDEREVRDEWVKRSGGSNLRSFAVQVFCETVVGLAVYKAIVALHLSEDETMSKCGQAYGALLKSLTTPGNYVVRCGPLFLAVLDACAELAKPCFAERAWRFLLPERQATASLSRKDLQLTVTHGQGKPISTTFESPSHRQTTRRSSAFFPIARRTLGRW
ncbi:regulatory protein E2 [Rhodotorula toruloides]